MNSYFQPLLILLGIMIGSALISWGAGVPFFYVFISWLITFLFLRSLSDE